MLKIKFAILVVFLLAGSEILLAQEFRFGDETPTNAAVRSAILPGWGQFFNQQPIKGYITGGAVAGLVTASILMYSKAESTYSDYEKKGSKDDDLYDDYKSEVRTTNILVAITAAAWIYNIVDAYVFSPYGDTDAVKKIENNRNLNISASAQEVEINYVCLRF